MPNFSFDAYIFKEVTTPLSRTHQSLTLQLRRHRRRSPANIREAVAAFLKVLAVWARSGKFWKKGYRLVAEEWRGPEFVALDRLTTTL